MSKIIQIAMNGQRLAALTDDGRVAAYDFGSNSWSQVQLPGGIEQRDRVKVVEVRSSRLPNNFTLWRDLDTGLWRWSRGQESGPDFGSMEDAVSDTKQRHLIETLPTKG